MKKIFWQLLDHQVLYGAMNPVRESTYKFLDKFLGEISHVFDDDFIHVGGDEVDLTCWWGHQRFRDRVLMCLDERAMNAEVKNWMKEEEISFTKDLINYFMTRLLRIVKKKKKRAIVWHEAFRYGLQVWLICIIAMTSSSDVGFRRQRCTSLGSNNSWSNCSSVNFEKYWRHHFVSMVFRSC